MPWRGTGGGRGRREEIGDWRLEIGLCWALRRLMAVAVGVSLALMLTWSPASAFVDCSRYEDLLIDRACPDPFDELRTPPVEGTTPTRDTEIRAFLHIRCSKQAAANLQSLDRDRSPISNPWTGTGLQSIPLVRAGSGSIPQDAGTLTLPVEALGVQGLGAATVVVGYDPAVLEVAGCRPNPEFDLGLCNPQFDRDEDGEPDAARFNVVSPGGLSAPDDVPLNLADITWAVVGRPDAGTVAALEIEVLTFDRWDATPISVTTENGQVTVVAGAAHVVFLPLIGD